MFARQGARHNAPGKAYAADPKRKQTDKAKGLRATIRNSTDDDRPDAESAGPDFSASQFKIKFTWDRKRTGRHFLGARFF